MVAVSRPGICHTYSSASIAAATRRRDGRAPAWASRSLAVSWRSWRTDCRGELRRRRRPGHDCRTSRGQMNQPPRILLVDDEVAIQRAVAPLLRSRGYQVDVVGTGREAVDAVVDGNADLIVLDLGLPDLEGTEVCRRIRKISKAPIVILSARGGETDKVAALDIGADDY